MCSDLPDVVRATAIGQRLRDETHEVKRIFFTVLFDFINLVDCHCLAVAVEVSSTGDAAGAMHKTRLMLLPIVVTA
jgi:hypothetical protein